jgi:organic radical activating enzyme
MTNIIKIVNTREEDYIAITYFPTDICNFDCTYCFPGSHPSKYRYRKDTDFVIDNFKKLFAFYKLKFNKSKIYFEIAGGGEPTLWPDLLKFCKEIKKVPDLSIALVCNGSRTLRWWDTIIPYIDEVMLSYHNEFTKTEHYINVADLIWENGKKVNAMVLMDYPNWDKCIDAIEQMKQSRYNWFINAKEVVTAPGHDVESYTLEQKEYLKQPIKRLPNSSYILNNLQDYRMVESVAILNNDKVVTAGPNYYLINSINNFKGWACSVISEKITIFPSGKITGSCNIDFDYDLNLYSKTLEKDLKQIISPHVTCTMNCCACLSDNHITKSKPTKTIELVPL